MDKAEWAVQVEQVWVAHVRSAWAIADLLALGVEQWTDGSRGQIADLLGEVSEQLEVSPKTLENYLRVGLRFPPDKRFDQPLTLSHHDCVVRFSDEEANAWLSKAAEQGWTVNRLRLEINMQPSADSEAPLPSLRVAERAFYRTGVKANLSPHKCVFQLPGGTLVLTADSELQWSILEGTHEQPDDVREPE